MEMYANQILKPDGLDYASVENHKESAAYLAAIKDEALDKLVYYRSQDEEPFPTYQIQMLDKR